MKFLRTFFAALLAFIAGAFLFSMIAGMVIAGIIASAGVGRPENISQGAVMKIDLSETYTDSPMPATVESFDMRGVRFRRSYSMMDLLGCVERAAADDRIAGIYICGAEAPTLDMAQAGEFRSALLEFRESGKFVISYGEYYSQPGYYLASAADMVAINPKGFLAWHGMAARVLFFKGLLDKLDVRAEVIRHGSFKSAVEPFVRESMSPENALQMNQMVGSMWGSVLEGVSVARGVDPAGLDKYASSLAISSPEAAKERKMVDTLLYQDQVYALVNGLRGKPESDGQPDFVSLGGYLKNRTALRGKGSPNKIAILYADGEIVDGRGYPGVVGSADFCASISALRRDEDVRAVVMRVNSPGGSALASEVICRELELLQKEKPLVVSIGGMAASGGYYIASPADIILTDAKSITGSIGAFALAFDIEKGLRNKLGLTLDVAKTNPSADVGVAMRTLSPAEKAFLQKQIDDVYETFVGRVSAGRNLSREEVEKIAGGRIWTGAAAVENGLADGKGGLKQAINIAADRSGVGEDFSVYETPASSGSLHQIISMLSSEGARNNVEKIFAKYGESISMLLRPGVRLHMPYVIELQ